MLSQNGCNLHFGQFGEDILLPMLFNQKEFGFYVDVGCFHPTKYSNTHVLHSQFNWSGLNIDANPEAISNFQSYRPNDININVGVSGKEGNLKFYKFRHGEVNTFDYEKAIQQSEKFGEFSSIDIKVEPLNAILSKNVRNIEIDYMNIDCEWRDLEVVQSNDWDRFAPKILTVEIHGLDLNNPQKNDTVNFLLSKGYRLKSYFLVTGLFEKFR